MSVVFYFMEGCPACEATWPAWKKAKKSLGKVKEVESKQVPMGKNVNSFPTFVIEDGSGMEIKRVEGRQTTPKELLKALGMKKKSYTRRRRVRGGATRRKVLR